MFSHGLLQLAADLGQQMLENGAETSEVERSIGKLGRVFSIRRTECFALPTGLILTLVDEDNESHTIIRRISRRSVNLEVLGRLISLVDSLHPGLQAAAVNREFEKIRHTTPYPIFTGVAAAGGTAGIFSLLFGGALPEFLAAGVFGIIVKLSVAYFENLGLSRFFINVVSGMLVTILVFLCAEFLPDTRPEIVIAGTLMLLVPGLLMVSSIRDIIAGDLVSGVSRLAEAGIIGGALAIGTAISMVIWSSITGIVTGVVGLFEPPSFLISTLIAGLASFGFAILFNVRGKKLLSVILAGGIGWGVFLPLFSATDSILFGCLTGAFAVGLYAEMIEKKTSTPPIHLYCLWSDPARSRVSHICNDAFRSTRGLSLIFFSRGGRASYRRLSGGRGGPRSIAQAVRNRVLQNSEKPTLKPNFLRVKQHPLI